MDKFYTEKIFETKDGAKINYVDEGRENLKTIVFVHGWTGQGNAYAALAQEMIATHRVIWMDHRGHGKTIADGPYSQKQLAKDVKDLMSYLGAKNVTFVGFSMGVHIIFQYIKEYGCRNLKKIVSIDMTPKLLNDDDWKHGLYQGHYREQHLANDLALIARKPNDFFAVFLKEVSKKRTPAQIRDYKPRLYYKILAKLTTKGAKTEFWSEMVTKDYRPDLAAICVPVAIVYARPGSTYEEGAAHYMFEKIPKGKLYPFEQTTHLSVMEKTKELAAVLLDEF